MAKLQSNTRIFGTATIDTFLFVNGTATSTSTNTGALQVAGGAGIANNLYVGGIITATNIYIGSFAVNTGTSLASSTGTTSTFTIQNTTNSTSTNSGALQVWGGAGIGSNLYVGSSATIGTPVTGAVVQAVYSNNSLYSSYTSAVISNASSQNLDTFSTSTYRTAKYVVQIYDSSKVHVEEFMLFHDNTLAYLTEYAVATNTGELGAFDANISAGTMTLTFTPNYTPSAMTIKVVRTAITA